jgi:hypothetical protein
VYLLEVTPYDFRQPAAQEQVQIVEGRPAAMAAEGTAAEGPVADGGEVAIILPAGQVYVQC